MKKYLWLLFVFFLCSFSFAQDESTKEMDKMMEKRRQWADKIYREKVKPQKKQVKFPKGGILEKFKRPDWITPEMQQQIKEQYRKRRADVMAKGTKYDKSIIMDLYEKEYYENSPLAKKNKRHNTKELDEAQRNKSFFTFLIVLLVGSLVFIFARKFL